MLFLALLAIPAVTPAFHTQPVQFDPDDPAIWVNPKHPERSLILGTDKQEKVGSLYAFDLNGKVVQRITNLDRPNNVDVRDNIAVVTERKQSRLRVFEIDPRTGKLTDRTGNTAVFVGEAGDDAAPMGIGLYLRKADRALFAIATPKAGPRTNHLAEYRLIRDRATGKFDARLVRRFGDYSGVKETESVAVDDERSIVYYSDETVATRWEPADPGSRRRRRFAPFNMSGTQGDHEGIAIWKRADLVVCTDQIPGNSIFRAFSREDHRLVGEFTGGADETDGIDICDRPLGPRFPKGIFVAMNSRSKNFLVYDLRDVAKALSVRP